MERKKGKGIAAICIVVMAVICAYNGVSYFQKKQCADNPYKEYAAKEKSRKAGSFEYTYRTSAEGVWITKITPSDEDISVLKIPSKLAGKKVVRLGNGNGNFKQEDTSDTMWEAENWSNIFGEKCSEDSTVKNIIIEPKDVYDRVAQIEEIDVPDTVQWIDLGLFAYVQNGKVLRLPAGLKTKLEDAGLTGVKWKEVSFSGENKNYKIVDGFLCSQDGKTVYGLLEEREKSTIPDGTEIISKKGDYFGTKEMQIPASVTKIEAAGKYGNHNFTEASVRIAKDNPKYAEKNGSIYDKTSGELVAAYIDNGVINIPDTVKRIFCPWYIGDTTTFRRMVIPKSVTFMHTKSGNNVRNNPAGHTGTTYVFEGRTPLHLVSGVCLFEEKDTIVVPKGCKKEYQEKWRGNISRLHHKIFWEEK